MLEHGFQRRLDVAPGRADVHAHEAAATGAVVGAGVEAELAALHEEVAQRGVVQTQCAAVQPQQVAGFGRLQTQGGQVRAQALDDEVAGAGEVGEQGVEPSVAAVPNVRLYNVDDLQRVITENLAARRATAVNARVIIEHEAAAFSEWNRSLAAVSTISQYRGRAERTRAAILDEFAGRLDGLTPEQRAAVEHLTRRLVNRILHQPTVGLKALAINEPGALPAAASVMLGEDGEQAAS